MQHHMNQNLQDILLERKNTMVQNSVQFKEIKMVCAKFFENYDVELEETRIRTKAMEEKYKNWSKILIEPNAMNVARVYCLE